MPLDFQVSIRGVAETAGQVEGIGRRAVHARPALARVLALLLKAEQELWRRKGGKKWAPRAEITQERDPEGSLLHKTGTLEDSLTSLTAADAIREVTDTFMDFGTKDYVGRFHQAGSEKTGLPKRPVLVFRPTDRRTARETILAHIMGRALPE